MQWNEGHGNCACDGEHASKHTYERANIHKYILVDMHMRYLHLNVYDSYMLFLVIAILPKQFFTQFFLA
jgi:hypothetical protein